MFVLIAAGSQVMSVLIASIGDPKVQVLSAWLKEMASV